MRLKDVLVRVAPGSFKNTFAPPKKPVVINQIDCMYEPRIQGAVVGQAMEMRNGDSTLHNMHSYRGTESW